MFQIVNVKQDNAVWNDTDGKPCLFAAGKEAADFCVEWNAVYSDPYHQVKLQPRRVADDGSWQERECARFVSGEYKRLPWEGLAWFDNKAETALHFAHVSTEDGAKVAYTEDAVKGQADRQTRIKPGKYLAKFFADVLSTEEIARLSAEYSKAYEDNELKFAHDADQWEHVYTNGPSSCMSKSLSYYNSSVHPVRVYAAGDLALAYLEREGEITARAIVWPEKKIHSRIYGDNVRLRGMLEDAGFSEGDLDGAKLLRIEEGNGFVMPYVDGADGAKDDGDYLILGRGRICTGNSCGLSEEGYSCSCCASFVSEDDCRSNDNGEMFCDSCYSDNYSYCEYYEEDYPAEGFREVIIGRTSSGRVRTQYWSEDAQDNHAFVCDKTGDLYQEDLRVEMSNGDSWNQYTFEDEGFTCEGSDECYPIDEAVRLEDGTLWSQSHFDDYGVEIDGKFYDKDNAPEEEDKEENTEDAVTVVEGGAA